jgi:hypothetical protein
LWWAAWWGAELCRVKGILTWAALCFSLRKFHYLNLSQINRKWSHDYSSDCGSCPRPATHYTWTKMAIWQNRQFWACTHAPQLTCFAATNVILQWHQKAPTCGPMKQVQCVIPLIRTCSFDWLWCIRFKHLWQQTCHTLAPLAFAHVLEASTQCYVHQFLASRRKTACNPTNISMIFW